jgi:transporter family-2 protein
MKNLWILIIFMGGATAPFQTTINARLGKNLQSPLHASMISFITGAIALGIYITLTRQTMSLTQVRTIAPYDWFSGIMGALFITLLALGLPRLGVSMVFALVLAGQMAGSMLMDHFGLMGTEQHSFNAMRLLGVALIAGGVVLIEKF